VNEIAPEPANMSAPKVAPVQAVSNPSPLQQLLDRIKKLETSGPRPKQLSRAQQKPLSHFHNHMTCQERSSAINVEYRATILEGVQWVSLKGGTGN